MEAIGKFIEYLRFEKRYSKHTLSAYENDLRQLACYLNETYEVKELREIVAPFVRSWLVKLMDEGIDPRSVNRKITTLKSFYKYALKNAWVDASPMGKISSPKVAKRLPVYVEAEKLNLLLDHISFDDDFNGRRDHLIIEMFFGTGMRLSELIGLEIKDVDLRNGQLKVTGKRNKQRIIPLFPALTEQISKYMECRTTISNLNDSLFVLENGKKLYPMFVQRLVKENLSKVSTLKKRSPHVLRHSFATEMLNNGADLNAIKDILGHANLSATQVYTHNSIEKLKEAYKDAHPRA